MPRDERPPEPLDPASLAQAVVALGPAWSLDEAGELVRTFRTPDFAAAMALANEIAALAEAAWHHPELRVGWGRLTVRLSTHDVGGVTRLDLDLAAQVEALAG
jgi:4a-hydroxytetrahydrobiopterin dehydratase